MNKWYKNLNKSKLTPPSWIFGVVWPILYILMAISFYIVYVNKLCVDFCVPLVYFMIQLFFNLIWTKLFFSLKKPVLALIDIILILIFTLITYHKFNKISKTASLLLLPYIIWLSFALYLNIYIVLYN